MTQDRRTSARRRFVGVVAGLVAASVVAVLVPLASEAASAPTPRRIVSGWGYFNSTSSEGMTAFAANSDLFSDVSPFWYSARWTGSASSVAPTSYAANKATVLPALKATGVKVMPTITDGMPTHRMAAVLGSGGSRAAFVSQIVTTVMANGYAGIDLDFEGFAFNDGSSTWATTKPGWVAFVTALASALHARGRALSVTVPAGSATSSDSTGYWVYSWSEIGRVVDRLRIMAYDYSPARPGPIAPFPWVDRVVAHAVTQVAAGKIQIGVPAYGRDWLGSVSGTCPDLATAGATSAQSSGFFSNLSWAQGRHAFSAGSAAGFVSSLFAAAATSVPGISVVAAPAVTWDATNKERTYTYRVGFAGRHQSATVSGTPVGGVAASPEITVASTVGITTGALAQGPGIAPGATVLGVSSTGNVVTLSKANTATVPATGTVVFTSTTQNDSTATGVVGATSLTVTDPAGIVVGAAVTSTETGIPAGTTVASVVGHVVTLSAPLTASLADAPVSFRATTKAVTSAPGGVRGSATVRLASTTGVTVAAAVTGSGIGSGANVTAVSGHTVTLSVPNTGPVTGALSVKPAPVAMSCIVSRVGWYSDGSSAVARAGLVGSYHLLGIAEWTIGGEDTAQWAGLRSYARTIAPVATSATVTAPARLYVGRTGPLRASASVGSRPLPGVRVYFSWLARGGTSWSRLTSAVTDSRGVAAATTPPATTSGTWRADVSATWSTLGSAALAAPTSVVRAASLLTLTAPSRVLAGRTAVARASLVSLGRAVPGAAVGFDWQRAGATTWTRMVTVRTDVTGQAIASFRPSTSGRVRVVFWGTAALLGAPVVVAPRTDLVPVVTSASTGLRVRRGVAASIQATVVPAGAAHVVVVQRRSGTSWVTVAKVAGTSRGKVAYAVPTGRAGTSVYRFVVPTTTLYASAASTAITVKIA